MRLHGRSAGLEQPTVRRVPPPPDRYAFRGQRTADSGGAHAGRRYSQLHLHETERERYGYQHDPYLHRLQGAHRGHAVMHSTCRELCQDNTSIGFKKCSYMRAETMSAKQRGTCRGTVTCFSTSGTRLKQGLLIFSQLSVWNSNSKHRWWNNLFVYFAGVQHRKTGSFDRVSTQDCVGLGRADSVFSLIIPQGAAGRGLTRCDVDAVPNNTTCRRTDS